METIQLYDGNNLVNFTIGRFTPAKLDIILPLFNEIIDKSTPDVINELEGITQDGMSSNTDLKKLATLAREQQKTISKEKANEIFDCRVKIIQAVIDRAKTKNFDFTKLDEASTGEFWQNQDYNEIGKIVDNFRQNFKINIYG